jgi:DtxR family transcriptional regulator, Mn-dependent transcriptional regulator
MGPNVTGGTPHTRHGITTEKPHARGLTKLAIPNYYAFPNGSIMEPMMSPAQTQKLSASLEDYLEAIFHLATGADGARSKDVAETLGVARPSVAGALQLLCEKGLAHHEPYGGITLTRQGRAAAEEVVRKHEVLRSFFIEVLGVEKEAAQRAACRAEHTLGAEVIGRLVCFIEYVAVSGRRGRDIAGEFQQFCRKKLGPAVPDAGRRGEEDL